VPTQAQATKQIKAAITSRRRPRTTPRCSDFAKSGPPDDLRERLHGRHACGNAPKSRLRDGATSASGANSSVSTGAASAEQRVAGAAPGAIARLDELTRGAPRVSLDRNRTSARSSPHRLEAYELADAAYSGDDAKLLDELGDVLFQVHFLALLLEERGPEIWRPSPITARRS